MTRVGVRQVAARAGVSVGTVSNVLNNRSTVSPSIVRRVEQAIDELAFVPNESARQLQSGQNKTIALVVLSSFNPFFNALAEYAEDAAEARGLSLVLASSAQREERESRYLSLFERQRVRGILLAPLGPMPEAAVQMQRRGTPVVRLGRTGEGFCSVSIDSEDSGYRAVKHLLDTGRKRIAAVGGPLVQIEDRIRGARRAAADLGAEAFEFIETTDLTIEDGATVGAQLGARPPAERPDGIFCANDLMAIGLVNQITRSEHLRIPDDIAVIGHDDIMFAESAAIPLTTMKQPLREMADIAVGLLDAESQQVAPHLHRQVVVPADLVVRDSAPN